MSRRSGEMTYSISLRFLHYESLLNTGRVYLAPIPCLISPVIFPRTSAAPPTIFLATSPVLFNNDPPASVRFFPTADMVELADWVTLFIVPDMLPVWFLVAFDSADIFSPRDILELPIEVLLASISLLLPRTLLNCWALPINDVLPPELLPYCIAWRSLFDSRIYWHYPPNWIHFLPLQSRFGLQPQSYFQQHLTH